MLLISGCQDNQTSMDGDHNGAFTEQVLQRLEPGQVHRQLRELPCAREGRMPPTQSPNLFTLGSAGTFLAQTPFTV